MAVRILVVEDEMIVAEDLRRTLGQLGYEVCGIVATGEQVRHQVEVDQPDLAAQHQPTAKPSPTTAFQASASPDSDHSCQAWA